jgi:hypothetical protein
MVVMEPTTKAASSQVNVAVPLPLSVDNPTFVAEATVFPVQQAIAALGEPDTTGELAQRLFSTVSMMWSDVTGADMFLPKAGSGELAGVRDVQGGVALLSAVGQPYDNEPAVKIIPVTPTLVASDVATGRGSSMSVPVLCGGAIESFIIVQRRVEATSFTARDLDALAVFARGVGELLPRVRARGGRSVAAWFQRDMASAREMQRMFLPRPAETNSAHVRVLAEYLPAFAVGGDFYDFVDLGAGRLLATIGDVSGKGVTAALMMSRVTSELRRLAFECSGPAEILMQLNRSLRGMQDDRFVTVVCVMLDVPNRRWVVANAGHMVPLLRRRSGVVSGLAYSLNPPIGMIPGPEYRDETFPLESHDILLLATDGVLDMLSGPRHECSTMGQCHLADVIEKAPHDLAEIHRRILAAADPAATGRDDVALLGLELTE